VFFSYKFPIEFTAGNLNVVVANSNYGIPHFKLQPLLGKTADGGLPMEDCQLRE